MMAAGRPAAEGRGWPQGGARELPGTATG